MRRGRSRCPINVALELVGDPWTLLIVRDIAFDGRRHFSDLAAASRERISRTVLSDRLRKLEEFGLVRRDEDDTQDRAMVYSLSERGIELVPVLLALAEWGRGEPVADEMLAPVAEALRSGGREARDVFVQRLRGAHVGTDTSWL